MPGISAITITAGPLPDTKTSFVFPPKVSSRRSKSSSGSSRSRSRSEVEVGMGPTLPREERDQQHEPEARQDQQAGGPDLEAAAHVVAAEVDEAVEAARGE